MESSRVHGITRKNLRSRGEKLNGKPDMRAGRHQGHFHLPRTVIFFVALTVQTQVSHRLSAISGCMHLNAPRWLATVVLSVFFKWKLREKYSGIKSTHSVPLCCPLSAPAWRCAHLLFQPAGVLSHATENDCNPIVEALDANIRTKIRLCKITYIFLSWMKKGQCATVCQTKTCHDNTDQSH